MNISLPEPLKRFVETTVSVGAYGSASEYIREAIREKMLREQKRGKEARTVLAEKLDEALKSGPSIPFVQGHFEKRKQALIARAKRSRKG